MKWFQRFSESVRHHMGKDASKIAIKGWQNVPTGGGKTAREEQCRWLKNAMDSLDNQCDEKLRNLIMIDTCPHSYPKTRIRQMRAEFERLGDLDRLIALMREDTSWGGGSFYDYPVRKEDRIYITKVPYSPKAYKNAVTPEEKRLAYCHCGLVKRCNQGISATFCCCSGGWAKQLWEGIFEEPVEVGLIESLFKGNEQCTHAVHIPSKFMKSLSKS